jgi:hypothetical protein
MVNLTESFTKLYGRRPTEEEVAALMKMKREQEGWLRKEDAPKPVTKPRQPKTPTKVNDYNYRWPKRASKQAQYINRMLKLKIPVSNIAYILMITENIVKAEIKKWQLPRD